jgi:hypothetical protein
VASAKEGEKKRTKGQVQKTMLGTLAVIYAVPLMVMFVINYLALLSHAATWSFDMNLFSVNIDWDNLRIRVPDVNVPAAWAALLLGFTRLSMLWTRLFASLHDLLSCRAICSTARVAAHAEATAARHLTRAETSVALAELALETGQVRKMPSWPNSWTNFSLF